MTPVTLAAVGGSLAGAGIALLVRQLRPARIPLDLALQRLERPAAGAGSVRPIPAADGFARRATRATGWLANHPIGRPIPSADLDVLDLSVDAFCLRKITMGIFGLLLPGLTVLAVTLTGVHIPVAVPGGLGLLLGGLFFFAPDFVVHSQAVEARQTFSAAVGAYLDLVALERAADGAPAEALTRAANVGNAWPFRRIRQTLDRARLAGIPPWQALATLADDIGVDDLRDLADILTAAGDDGAAIYDALGAKATSLRNRQLNLAKAAANTASEKLTLPGVLLCFGFLLLVCYPAIARVLDV